MLSSITSFICLLCYSVIAAQSISYIISLSDVQKKMNVAEYISFRKVTDKNFRAKFAYAVYGALLSNLALIVVTAIGFNPVLFVASCISFICLLFDTLITLKGNMPINNTINTWTIQDHPAEWEAYRAKWLSYFQFRQIANLTGFVCLCIGIVFS